MLTTILCLSNFAWLMIPLTMKKIINYSFALHGSILKFRHILHYLSLSCLESCCFLATFREMLLPSSGKCEGQGIWNFGDGRSGP